MLRFLVRIAGVDFATALYDTDDLSTIRGTSHAYLDMPRCFFDRLRAKFPAAEELVIGASEGVFRVTAPEGITAEDIDKELAALVSEDSGSNDPLERIRPHLSFTWTAVAESGDYGADVYRLMARARQRQIQRLTVDVPPCPPVGEWRPCEIDRRRPVDQEPHRMGGGLRYVSASVWARWNYGRNLRQEFYRDILGAAEFDRAPFRVTNSLQDLVRDPPHVPAALNSKVALIHLDGNRFTEIRELTIFGSKVPRGEKEPRHRAFAEHVRRLRRDLLVRIVEWLRADPHNSFLDEENLEGPVERLRFETLLWGGDEALFVVPAWAAMNLLPVIAEALSDPEWTWQGLPLTHAVGVVIGNVKTPIAVLRDLAEDLGREAKDKVLKDCALKDLATAVSIHVSESVEPPQADLADFRRYLYGTDLPRAFTLIAPVEVQQMLGLLRHFRDEKRGLPRSQLFGLIREFRDKGLLHAGNAPEVKDFLNVRVAEAFKRGGCEVPLSSLCAKALGYSEEAPLLPLIRLAELWDYVDPFSTSALPPVATAGAAA